MGYYLLTQQDAIVGEDVMPYSLIRAIMLFWVKNMPCYRVCNQICYLQPYNIFVLMAELKRTYTRLQSFGRNPFCTSISQAIVIIQQFLILLLSPTFYNYCDTANTIFPIVNTKYTAFYKIGKRKTVDIIFFSTDTKLF